MESTPNDQFYHSPTIAGAVFGEKGARQNAGTSIGMAAGKGHDPNKKNVARPPAPGQAEFIDIALRKMHDHIADEAVPDDFMAILAEIDRKLAEKKTGE